MTNSKVNSISSFAPILGVAFSDQHTPAGIVDRSEFGSSISDERMPAVLVLGSMPGQKSLADHMYYAHPRNAFWWIMAELLGFDLNLPYSERVSYLKKSGVALWDVLAECVRPGSLDSKIERQSELPNDVPSLLESFPSIQVVCFNGLTAQKSFWRHNRKRVASLVNVDYLLLPSTSPAHASMRLLEKREQWAKILPYLTV